MHGLPQDRLLIGMREGDGLTLIEGRWLWWGLGRVFGAGIGSSRGVDVVLLPVCVGRSGRRGVCLLPV